MIPMDRYPMRVQDPTTRYHNLKVNRVWTLSRLLIPIVVTLLLLHQYFNIPPVAIIPEVVCR